MKNYCNLLQPENISQKLITLEVFHFDISGIDIKELH